MTRRNEDSMRPLGESLARLQQQVRPVAAIEDGDLARLNRQMMEVWERRIPARFREAHIGDVAQPARDVLIEWATKGPGPSTNLVLMGPVGVGKTHAGVAALEMIHEHGLSFAFVPVVEALDLLRPGGPRDVGDRMSSVSVLMLDDLGSERTSDWTAERLYAVVNRRWLDQLPTIVTTNLTGEEMGRALDPLLFSRLVHGATAIHIGGHDRRRD